MLTIPDEVQGLFQADGILKNFHVHFPNGDSDDLNNEDILQESVQFTESLCSQQYFKFGLAEASQIEFTAVGVPNILGATIECAIEIDCTSLGEAWASEHPVDPTLDFLETQTCTVNNKIYYRIPYGRFVVDSCPRDHGAMFHRKIVAYSPDFVLGAQVVPGQFPGNAFSIRATDWVTAQNITNDDMTHVQLTKQTPSSLTGAAWPSAGYMYKSNGSDGLNGITGASRASSGSYGDRVFVVYGTSLYPFGTYMIRPYFDSHEFDAYGRALCDAALASIPSGAFLYDITGKKEFGKNSESAAWNFGCFQPCIYIIVQYTNSGHTSSFNRVSKPIFINSGETYILDLESFSNFEFYSDIPSGLDNISQVSVHLSVPMIWQKNYGNWLVINGSSVAISGWSSAAPFGNRAQVERSGTVDAYYTKIDTDSAFPKTIIDSTLTIDKGDGLGNYYTFSDAISPTKFLEGVMELLAKFWKTTRGGDVIQFDISESTTTPVSNSARESFWWDENDVEAIGLVSVKSRDPETGDEQIDTFTIGPGSSIYIMEDNAILSNSDAAATEISAALNTYFEPGAAVVNFTPAEATLKGLPYLEAGDRLSLTADDGETVVTYILEQTISGIQYLRSDITSTNGELLEVIEE